MKKKFNLPVRQLATVGAFALFLLLGNFLMAKKVIGLYYTKVLMVAAINMILAVSLNIATGFLGQLPLGSAGFMAVGAYASAIIMRKVTFVDPALAFPVCIIIGGLAAALCGFIIGMPALRLKGDYIAIITLGFAEIIRIVILNIDSALGITLTYGASNLKNIPKTTTFTNAYIWVFIVCYLVSALMKSRHGRAILSIRDNEIAAESCGINLTYYKTMAFIIYAFFTGIGGALYAGYLGILNPSGFSFAKSIDILVMVVLGGMGSMTGSVISAAVLTVVPEVLHAFSDYRMIVYSLLLIVVMIFRPAGLMGNKEFSLDMLAGLFMKKAKEGGSGK